MSTLKQGSSLNAAQRQAVLSRFVYRWTFENAKQTYGGDCPACRQSTHGGRIITGSRKLGNLKEWTRAEWHAYHVPLVSDAQWLADRAFYVNKDGSLDERHSHCEPAYVADLA